MIELSRNLANRIDNEIVGRSPITRSPDREAKVVFFDNLDGIEEYSVSGWFRWTPPAARGPWHLAYRLSPFREAEMGNMEKIGDCDLVCWVG